MITIQQRLYNIQRVYSDIKLRGIRLDVPYVQDKIQELDLQYADYESQLKGLVGSTFNPRSPKQVGNYLYNELGYIPPHLTEKGQPSTDVHAVNTLLELDPENPFLNVLLKLRKVDKFCGTYFKGFAELSDSSGYIHPNISLYGTVTGRPSASTPNVLNIPTRGPEAKAVKQMLLPDEGHVLLQVDVSQAELRVVAHFSGDDSLQQIYRDNIDLHKQTATWAWGEDRAGEMRRLAKNANFNIIYAGSPETITELIWNSYKQEERAVLIAEAGSKDKAYATLLHNVIQFYVAWVQRFPDVPAWWKTNCELAFKQGYLETPFGRRRRVPLIPDPRKDPKTYEELKRHLINFPIQSTAVDITQEALVRMFLYIQKGGLNARIINCVYDSIWYSTHPDHVEELAELTVNELCTIPAEYGVDSIPFQADVEVGRDAGEGFSIEDWRKM